jgi:NADP-dependent 3-hydroxy acid dehydrogenase YdfG
MSQARHVGKVVVTTAAAAASYNSASHPQLSFRQELAGCAAVVTGGLGALGVLVSCWLAQQGISQLILLSRTGKLSVQHQHQQLENLTQRIPSVEVTARQADVSMSTDAADVFSPSRHSRPVLLVMHAGGVLDDRLIVNQTLTSGRRVIAPKLATLQLWMQSMQQQPSAAHVFFSSVASLLGSPGQANYAAANAGLDAAAGAAQLAGIPAVSVQWGAWAGGGMAAADAQTAARVERMGMSLISPAAGLAALEGVLAATSVGAVAGSAAVVAAIPFRWQRVLQRLGQPTPGFFAEFAAEQAAGRPAAGAVPGRRRARRVVQQQAQQQPRLLEQVQSTIVSILGREVSS